MKHKIQISKLALAVIAILFFSGLAAIETLQAQQPPSDTAPPSTITDLKLTGIYPNGQVGLNWRAPYEDSDDPASGPAASYDIRYNLKTPLTDSTWPRATQAPDEPAPRSPGTVEIYLLPGLTPGETYYAAIRSQDAAGNISALSNNLLVTIPEPLIINPIVPIIPAPIEPSPVITHTITASVDTAGGTITPSGSVSVAQAGSQTFTIAASTGYNIVSVLVGGVNQGAITSYTFSNVQSNQTIVASFTAIPSPPPTFITSAPPNNAVMAQDGSGLGWNLVTLTFSSDLGSDWNNLDAYSILSTQAIAINIASVSGNSVQPSLTLSRNVVPGERITITHKPTNSSICLGFLPGDVDQNSFVTSSDIGRLNAWVGTAEGLAQPLWKTDINRDGVFDTKDVTRAGELMSAPNRVFRLPACPMPTTATITASVDTAGGAITPSGTITVNRGDSRTFTFTANPGYWVSQVLINGSPIVPIPAAAYTFSNVQSNQTIIVSFSSDPIIIDPGLTQMVMMNGGNYIDIGEPITTSWPVASFNSIVNSSGDLLYLFNNDRLGKMMGRFSATKHWEWWTGDKWSGAPGTTATPIDHAVGWYANLDIVKHPSIANGLIGVASQFYKIGGVGLDTHGHPNNFIFDGTKFTQWQSGATYHQFITSPLITSWNGTSGSPPAFAFDPVSRKGLVIGTVGYSLNNFNSQLTAVEYRLGDMSQKWRRWNVNNWFADASWPSQVNVPNNRNAFILNRDIDVAKFKTDRPLITNIPNTANYFITFNYTDVVTNAVKRGAAFYQDGTPPAWSWWNGSAWQAGGTYDFQDVRGVTLPGSGKPFRQIYWTGGKISIFLNDNGNITEIVYDHNLKTFSAPVRIATARTAAVTDNLPGFVIARDSTDKLWLAYGDSGQIKVKTKSPDTGIWTDSNLVYQNSNLQPLGINFITASQIPVFFIQQGNRLALVAENTPFWDSEAVYIPEAPAANVTLSSTELTWQKRFSAYATGQSYNSQPGPIALDAEGYIYAPNFPTSNVVVIPPGSAGPQDNKTWGGFWDHFRHPRGIAIDNTRSKVYIADSLLTGGSSGMQTNGQVLIWDLAKRTEHVGYNNFRAPIPAGWDREYRPQVLTNSFVWPSDTAVDEARGLLYVTNSAKSKIDVFDIKNRPVFIYSFGSEGKNPGQFQFPQGLDLDKNGNLYVVDSENHRIQKFVYDQITARQVFSAAWGQLGSKPSVLGDIRFRYPIDIAVDDTYDRIYVTDPTNQRVTVLDLAGNFIHQWTDWANGITVDDKGLVYVAIGGDIVKFKVPDTTVEVVPPPPPLEPPPAGGGGGGGSGSNLRPPPVPTPSVSNAARIAVLKARLVELRASLLLELRHRLLELLTQLLELLRRRTA